MKRLFIMDSKNYTDDMPHHVRPSARGIIFNADNKIAMVHSLKYDYYKFPGGGIRSGEDNVQALIREVSEETGLTVIPESVQEFGSVLRIQLSQYEENTVFEQENFYYTCKVDSSLDSQHLDDYELDEGFTLEFVVPEHAILVNRTHDHQDYDEKLIEREALVLEYIINKVKI